MIPVALTGGWHYRRRHLVTPGRVITSQSARADGSPVPGRAQQVGGHGDIRDAALRSLRPGTQSQKAQAGSGLRMPPDL